MRRIDIDLECIPECEVVAGDARSVSSFVREGSVQTIITSPPYWGLRSYGADSEIGAEATIEDYLESISAVFKACWSVLRDDGTLWLIIGDGYTSGNRRYRDSDKKHSHRAMSSRPKTPQGLKRKDLIGLPWKVAFRLQSDGWYLRSDIIWHKLNPIPESVRDRPHQSHEHIFLFSKSEKYCFDWSALAECQSERLRCTRNVWTVPVNAGSSGHAAPFPLELVKPCILSSSKIGDLVLDPFAGSGSVGLACRGVERRFFGIELMDENAAMARSRLKTA